MKKRYLLKSLVGLIVLTCMLSFLLPAMAVEFSADLLQNSFGEDVKGKIYIKGDKVRMEGSDARGGLSITIIDIKKGTSYLLMPQEKMYIEMSDAIVKKQTEQFDIDEELAKIADKRLIGTEKLDGYVCDKYEIIYHDTSLGKTTQWYSKKLNFPIKMIYSSSYGDMVTEYKNIREGGVSDSLFEIPPDYQKMVMPGMGQDMGEFPESLKDYWDKEGQD